MSASQWDFRLSASAEGLLTEEQCYLLLDSDFLDTADGAYTLLHFDYISLFKNVRQT